MVTNGEPYRSLVALHRKIDSSTGVDGLTIVSELESVVQAHVGTTYTRTVSKPRILYSMMVKE